MSPVDTIKTARTRREIPEVQYKNTNNKFSFSTTSAVFRTLVVRCERFESKCVCLLKTRLGSTSYPESEANRWQTVALTSIVYAAREGGELSNETIAVIDSRIHDLTIWYSLTRGPLNECSTF